MRAELSIHQQSVADYYNSNHSRFLRFGKRAQTGIMHRAVWAPGVQNRIEALQFVNHLIAREISETFHSGLPDIHILDIGCGVGATCMYLAEELGICCTGVSISSIQIAEANRRAIRANLDDHCRFSLHDFTSVEFSKQFHMAVAVESFVHFENPKRFFRKCAELLSDESLLVICDDFRCKDTESNRTSQIHLNRYKSGWRLGNILSVSEIKAIAENAGFSLERNRDLTSYLRIPQGVPEQLEKLAYLMPLRTAFLDSRRGNVAVRKCLRNGWLEYRQLVFRKS